MADPLHRAEALIVLAGDENERIAAGAALFKQGYAPWLILTDMRLDIPDSQGIYSANVKRKTVEQGVPAEHILIVPGQVATTFEEAMRVKEFTTSHGFRSLIVVTSPFHTRRAGLLLNEVFRGSGVRLMIRPAMNQGYNAEAWWRSPRDRQDTVLEYAKLLANLLGCREHGDCGSLPWRWLDAWQENHPDN